MFLFGPKLSGTGRPDAMLHQLDTNHTCKSNRECSPGRVNEVQISCSCWRMDPPRWKRVNLRLRLRNLVPLSSLVQWLKIS